MMARAEPCRGTFQPPQCLVKAAWQLGTHDVRCLISGNLDGEPRTIQEAVLKAMYRSVECEAARFRIALSPPPARR